MSVLRIAGVSWSDIIAATRSAGSTSPPPASSIRWNATTSATVDTRPPAPEGNGGNARPLPVGTVLLDEPVVAVAVVGRASLVGPGGKGEPGVGHPERPEESRPP